MQQKLTRNIWAVGRNYLDHAAEMKAEVPKEPLIFLKAGSSILSDSKITLPSWTQNIHYELELAYLLDENLSFSHISLALDLTARDIQSQAKLKGNPWTLAKSFSHSCPIGSWVDFSEIAKNEVICFELKKNKQVVQTAKSNQMIFQPEFLLEYTKKRFPVVPFDILLTGTPAGVGPLSSGDSLEASLSLENHAISQTLLTCLWDVE